MLQAGLLQQGFGQQAQNAAQQAFQNQQAIAARSIRIRTSSNGQTNELSNFERAGMGADVGSSWDN